MGDLACLDIVKYFAKRKYDYLVETGTYEGVAVEYALDFPFKTLYSIELISEYHENCKRKFKDESRVWLIHDTSISGLRNLIEYGRLDGPTIFWLDAHLPNFYFPSFGNDYAGRKNLLIPLEAELEIIAKKDISKDVILIDDLRIYEPGQYQNGDWTEVRDTKLYPNGIDFVYRILGNTHNITKSYLGEGYIICEPKA